MELIKAKPELGFNLMMIIIYVLWRGEEEKEGDSCFSDDQRKGLFSLKNENDLQERFPAKYESFKP